MTEHTIVKIGTAAYPVLLEKALERKSPKTLNVVGNLKLFDVAGIGFCGSRKASARGLEVARDCADQAARRGLVVVSGYAAGVDLAVHRAALEAGGSTIIVLPEGISHFRIRKDLRDVWSWDRVLIVSEFSPTAPWKTYQAMTRNRTIIGISRAMIVIEAGETGGTLDAGKATLELNRPLFVAEYGDGNPTAKGNRMLVDIGANPVKRLKETGRASLSSVWESIQNPDKYAAQPGLF